MYKKAGAQAAPGHRRFVNRPQRRTFTAKTEAKNSSAHRLLLTVDLVFRQRRYKYP
jgi:hypothetical protein